MSSLIEAHLPCPACGSSDALSKYDDHSYCYSCEAWTPAGVDTLAGAPKKMSKTATSLITDGRYSDLPKRKLTEKTCRLFGYKVGSLGSKPIQIAPYHNKDGEVVAQKIRMPNKEFTIFGDASEALLFGQNLWKDGGKRIVITEGELDALSYAQCAPGWPVVSVPNGAQSAKKAIAKNIEFLEAFDEVCFLFDNDEPGIKAARECSELITPGKATIVSSLPLKDASDMLVGGRIKELLTSIYNAKPVRPDGVVNGKEIWDAVSKPQVVGTSFPFKSWDRVLFGMRPREILTLTAGSGVGKSTIAAQLAYNLATTHGKTVGYIALEESVGRTGLRFMSMALGRPLHLPQDVSESDRRLAFDKTLGTGRFLLYDHFGSMDSDHLLAKLRYMVTGLGAEFLFIDHLSILLSGGDFMVNGGDERKQLDYTMSKLRQFTEQTNASMVLISHLKRPSGDKGFEDGMVPNLSALRGSQSIAQLSDSVVSISRDASAGENELRINCLKNRYAGITGSMGSLRYNPATATLEEVIGEEFNDKEDDPF
jgi:twinkle protein